MDLQNFGWKLCAASGYRSNSFRDWLRAQVIIIDNIFWHIFSLFDTKYKFYSYNYRK